MRAKSSVVRATLWIGIVFVTWGCHSEADIEPTPLTETDVFVSGSEGFHTYRIPSLIVTLDGTVLAFSEGRESVSDSGDIDIVLRRSLDSGATWEPLQVVVDMGGDTAGNPCPVVDRETGTLWMPFTGNLGVDSEQEIIAGTSEGTREVYVTRSDDDGLTWSTPTLITGQVKRPEWTWYATGPGRGIQLADGRFVIPCNHTDGTHPTVDPNFSYSHVITSDDRGMSWQLGGIVAGGKTNESQVAELDDGSLVLNMRAYHPEHRRAVARSFDRGETWSPLTLDPALVEPICQGSLIGHDGRLFFSNPASWTRVNMTVRRSTDGGETWDASKSIYPDISGYSALSALPDGNLGCLYERGDLSKLTIFEKIVLARFSEAWMLE